MKVRICDFCGESIGCMKDYGRIKYIDIIHTPITGKIIKDKFDVCEKCQGLMREYIKEKLKENQSNEE